MEHKNVALELPPSVSFSTCVKRDCLYGNSSSWGFGSSERILTSFLKSQCANVRYLPFYILVKGKINYSGNEVLVSIIAKISTTQSECFYYKKDQ